MRTALIGYTGFVGSNLHKQYGFTDLYNSKNIQEMKNQDYDLVVCAGISAVKWMANKDPEKDLASIQALEDVLATVSVKRFILISTIDVYPVTQGKDEGFDCASMQNHAYGNHRLEVESFCSDQFDDCTIVRLPGLFGDGLKKNVIYDFLNDNCLEMINKKSSYQYYFLKYLWRDIQVAIENDIKLINLFTEPVPTQEIYQTFFPSKHIGQEEVPEGHYDLYTEYAKNWNNSGNYIYTKDEMIEQLFEFISVYKKDES
jgi:hypothetical protein